MPMTTDLGKAVVIPARVAQRAAAAYALDEHGCHISTYSVGSHGYAQIGWHAAGDKRRGTTAHRAAWTAAHGPIPEGMTVDHLCRVKRCVRVEHLRLLTNLENAKDGSDQGHLVRYGRTPAQVAAAVA